jgi:hypothetical protein
MKQLDGITTITLTTFCDRPSEAEKEVVRKQAQEAVGCGVFPEVGGQRTFPCCTPRGRAAGGQQRVITEARK